MTNPVISEPKIVELLEKTLIVNLYIAGANRDQIKDIVNVGTDKVANVIKNLKNIKRVDNGTRISK